MAPRTSLIGRDSEVAALEGLLEAVRMGESRALVLRGEPGVGKTALLERVHELASGCTIVRADGLEEEMELAFAALQLLCAPMLSLLDRLPSPQKAALAIALGLDEGPPPDRFLVGLAVLSLLAESDQTQPLVCLIDDAHWLDHSSAQALTFVGRRLQAESVALIVATRGNEVLAGLPERIVEPLGDSEAQRLLQTTLGVPLDEQVRDRIIAEAGGCPLALLELPHLVSPSQLAGGFALPGALPVTERIEATYLQRLARLAPSSMTLLLVAAAEVTGDPLLLWRAAERLDIAPDAAANIERTGLCELGSRVRFTHSLVRSAIYRAASPEQRRAVHRALADATDPELDPDRRAWHRAHATAGLDEDVAAELERSAVRAQSRGGLAATAAFLERAASLTPAPARRAGRALAAADAKYRAGALDEARALIALAEAGSRDELLHARIALLRGQMAFSSSDVADAPALLLETARRFEPLAPKQARETYLDALSAANFAGRLASTVDLPQVAAAALAGPAAARSPRAPDLLLDGLSALLVQGYEKAAPMVRKALEAMLDGQLTIAESVRWSFIACRSAHDVWDDYAWDALSERQLEIVRDAGAISALPLALSQRIGMQLHAGQFKAAAMLVDELEAIAEATEDGLPRYGALALAGWRGDESDARQLGEAITDEALRRGEGMGLSLAEHTHAVLYNGLGQYEQALAAAEQASSYPPELGFGNWSLVELIEAAVRSGEPSRAEDAVARLISGTGPSSTDWALGMAARSRALLADDQDAEPLYLEAIDRLGRSRGAVALARARLIYGEWLRRKHRRTDARDQLRRAREMLVSIGAEAFAERARRELLATGEKVRKRNVTTRDDLTPQETQIAQLAADGLSNPEIGERLFISPRTVEYHLRKVYTKLNIKSRNKLRGLLSSA
ncbi:MAG TPA: AAA family ATPase [Solirubrobacteraceae bacterium]|jgi:DNA-binding CsgD family transcriptional regulator|nr:AAA family ATPase [Solirubrobacteraceae bacterium]